MLQAQEYDWKDSNLALIGSEEDRLVKKQSAMEEPAWQPVLKITCPKLFVWRINKFKVEPLSQTDYGSFYNGDSYIVLNVYKQNDRLLYDLHFWIGKHSTQDEYGTAAYKTVELDNLLDDLPVQHREVEGCESEKFKSYFPQLTILNGGVQSGFKHVKPQEYQPRLMHFSCVSGKRVEVREVTLSRQSLTSDDVFIYDEGSHAVQWNGSKSSAKERFHAAQFCQNLESERHGKVRCEVIDEADTAACNGLKEKLPDVPVKDKAMHGGSFQKSIYKLLSDEDGNLEFTKICENSAPRGMINDEDVFYINSGMKLFVYVGANCSKQESANAMLKAHNYLKDSGQPLLPITVVTQGKSCDELDQVLE